MTLTVPVTPKTITTGLIAKQSQIATLVAVPSSAPHASQSAQLLLQAKKEFVISLVEHGGILGGAAAILSSVSYASSGAAAAVVQQYTALKAQIAAWNAAGTNVQLATSKARDLEAVARQCVVELLNSGQMSPDAVLAAFSYTGA